ncbi:MAG: threonine--tRNA ligase [Candidatus Levybacteria bacterium RIFCSPLOWO2_01_FULL_39_24]|nr:MAG: threonine--tRNA ligase [Candidatus Levybacteria bacterium RIFCSPHIGHO2_01_FULL_40_16]OGH28254.1 MAG: threonine--tRNA ligase [Candidatus Levybacteria bacterium RIFCSPHIGHO2_12_FULL_39_9]OGH46515.1 MAG: threonine--tRNA ligase [Candidatus Levybacteria bacterium RIFCSPLOWO2_01_FULL_39_24]
MDNKDNKAPLKDHRQIGQELDLFSFHDVAPGAVFWHPKGLVIYKVLEEFIRKETEKEGYKEISTPVMVKNSLFKQSGHWEHFGKHNMFNLAIHEDEEIAEGKIVPEVNYSLKPMNCPESTLIYSTTTRSYQDLPIKFSDYGMLHRRELSGVLGGLFRLRQFTIDDAHLYVKPDQIQEEIRKLLTLVVRFYKSLNFQPEFYFSTKPDKAMGDPKLWDEAEKDLEEALKSAKVKYGIKKKDGAFYGPKIDIHIKDSQNRDWQLATIQLDFQIPEKMELEYIDADGKPKRPVMIHRAIFGSFERFIGILTEHYRGAFPLWLSPVQVIIMPITDKQGSHAKKIVEDLKKEGIRVELDNRTERLQAKIRDGSLQKVPYLGIIGDREIESSSISVRMRNGKDLGKLKISDFLQKLKEEIDKKI